MYPSFEKWREALARRGVHTDEDLAFHLIEHYEIAEGAWLIVPQWSFAVGNQPSERYPTLVAALDDALSGSLADNRYVTMFLAIVHADEEPAPFLRAAGIVMLGAAAAEGRGRSAEHVVQQ